MSISNLLPNHCRVGKTAIIKKVGEIIYADYIDECIIDKWEDDAFRILYMSPIKVTPLSELVHPYFLVNNKEENFDLFG